MFKIYLAGAMSGLSKEDRVKWRNEIQEFFVENNKVKVINPCNFYDFDTVKPDTTEREIKKFDLWQVRTSDLILVNLRYPNSIGTAMELQLAEELNIPIIGFNNPLVPLHPWIECALSKRCLDKYDALEYITTHYLSEGVK